MLPEFRRNAPQFLQGIREQHGDLVQFKLGNQAIYSVSHPDWIRDILVTHQSNFTKSRFLERAKVLLGEGLLTSEGQFHTRQRRLVQPAFHRERLAGYAASMVECAVHTRDGWKNGATYDMMREMNRLTLAVVAKTLFSADVSSEADEIGAALTEVLGLFDMVLMPFSEWIEKLPFPSVRRFEKARATLDRIIYGIIAERRMHPGDTGDLLSMLLMAQDEGSGMDDKQVRDEAMTLFLAGHETTANALTWTWYLLSQNPAVEETLHQELARVLGGRLPAFDDLPELKYVEMVFAEAMRLYPPAWAVGRRNIEPYRVGDYELPARSILQMSPWVVHRDPRWFPEPERFDPLRFTPEAVAARPRFSYFPFGGGARVCIGERFAWMEGVLLLATLAQRWKVRHVPGHRVETRALITLRPKFGMQCTVEER
jgi:cytochrome P450